MLLRRLMTIVCTKIFTTRDRKEYIRYIICSRFYVMGFDKETGEPIKANCVESVRRLYILIIDRFCTLQKREPANYNDNVVFY